MTRAPSAPNPRVTLTTVSAASPVPR
ncbi:MAG: hypothetical protein QOI02_567, partial [Actinomycetota bacterium]|nr:hypothetical protein [Actinomycetota bacterium]